MVKFIAHTGDPSKPIEGTLNDLGLCFVSEVEIDGQTFYSVITKDIGEKDFESRIAEDVATMEQYGYIFMDIVQ